MPGYLYKKRMLSSEESEVELDNEPNKMWDIDSSGSYQRMMPESGKRLGQLHDLIRHHKPPHPSNNKTNTYESMSDNEKTEIIHIIADTLRLSNQWDNIGVELTPYLLSNLPGFIGKSLIICNENNEISIVFHGGVIVDALPHHKEVNQDYIKISLSRLHYTAFVKNKWCDVEPDGNCLFRAVLASEKNKEPNAITDEEIIRLRENVADYFVEHTDNVLNLIEKLNLKEEFCKRQHSENELPSGEELYRLVHAPTTDNLIGERKNNSKMGLLFNVMLLGEHVTSPGFRKQYNENTEWPVKINKRELMASHCINYMDTKKITGKGIVSKLMNLFIPLSFTIPGAEGLPIRTVVGRFGSEEKRNSLLAVATDIYNELKNIDNLANKPSSDKRLITEASNRIIKMVNRSEHYLIGSFSKTQIAKFESWYEYGDEELSNSIQLIATKYNDKTVTPENRVDLLAEVARGDINNDLEGDFVYGLLNSVIYDLDYYQQSLDPNNYKKLIQYLRESDIMPKLIGLSKSEYTEEYIRQRLIKLLSHIEPSLSNLQGHFVVDNERIFQDVRLFASLVRNWEPDNKDRLNGTEPGELLLSEGYNHLSAIIEESERENLGYLHVENFKESINYAAKGKWRVNYDGYYDIMQNVDEMNSMPSERVNNYEKRNEFISYVLSSELKENGGNTKLRVNLKGVQGMLFIYYFARNTCQKIYSDLALPGEDESQLIYLDKDKGPILDDFMTAAHIYANALEYYEHRIRIIKNEVIEKMKQYKDEHLNIFGDDINYCSSMMVELDRLIQNNKGYLNNQAHEKINHLRGKMQEICDIPDFGFEYFDDKKIEIYKEINKECNQILVLSDGTKPAIELNSELGYFMMIVSYYTNRSVSIYEYAKNKIKEPIDAIYYLLEKLSLSNENEEPGGADLIVYLLHSVELALEENIGLIFTLNLNQLTLLLNSFSKYNVQIKNADLIYLDDFLNQINKSSPKEIVKNFISISKKNSAGAAIHIYDYVGRLYTEKLSDLFSNGQDLAIYFDYNDQKYLSGLPKEIRGFAFLEVNKCIQDMLRLFEKVNTKNKPKEYTPRDDELFFNYLDVGVRDLSNQSVEFFKKYYRPFMQNFKKGIPDLLEGDTASEKLKEKVRELDTTLEILEESVQNGQKDAAKKLAQQEKHEQEEKPNREKAEKPELESIIGADEIIHKMVLAMEEVEKMSIEVSMQDFSADYFKRILDDLKKQGLVDQDITLDTRLTYSLKKKEHYVIKTFPVPQDKYEAESYTVLEILTGQHKKSDIGRSILNECLECKGDYHGKKELFETLTKSWKDKSEEFEKIAFNYFSSKINDPKFMEYREKHDKANINYALLKMYAENSSDPDVLDAINKYFEGKILLGNVSLLGSITLDNVVYFPIKDDRGALISLFDKKHAFVDKEKFGPDKGKYQLNYEKNSGASQLVYDSLSLFYKDRFPKNNLEVHYDTRVSSSFNGQAEKVKPVLMLETGSEDDLYKTLGVANAKKLWSNLDKQYFSEVEFYQVENLRAIKKLLSIVNVFLLPFSVFAGGGLIKILSSVSIELGILILSTYTNMEMIKTADSSKDIDEANQDLLFDILFAPLIFVDLLDLKGLPRALIKNNAVLIKSAELIKDSKKYVSSHVLRRFFTEINYKKLTMSEKIKHFMDKIESSEEFIKFSKYHTPEEVVNQKQNIIASINSRFEKNSPYQKLWANIFDDAISAEKYKLKSAYLEKRYIELDLRVSKEKWDTFTSDKKIETLVDSVAITPDGRILQAMIGEKALKRSIHDNLSLDYLGNPRNRIQLDDYILEKDKAVSRVASDTRKLIHDKKVIDSLLDGGIEISRYEHYGDVRESAVDWILDSSKSTKSYDEKVELRANVNKAMDNMKGMNDEKMYSWENIVKTHDTLYPDRVGKVKQNFRNSNTEHFMGSVVASESFQQFLKTLKNTPLSDEIKGDLLLAAIIRYHPFGDGNGRVARTMYAALRERMHETTFKSVSLSELSRITKLPPEMPLLPTSKLSNQNVALPVKSDIPKEGTSSKLSNLDVDLPVESDIPNRGVFEVDPRTIHFSQSSVSYKKINGQTYDQLVESMRVNGWQKNSIIDVVQMPGGGIKVSLDNTRLMAAQEISDELEKNGKPPFTVTIRLHNHDDPLPDVYLKRFNGEDYVQKHKETMRHRINTLERHIHDLEQDQFNLLNSKTKKKLKNKETQGELQGEEERNKKIKDYKAKLESLKLNEINNRPIFIKTYGDAAYSRINSQNRKFHGLKEPARQEASGYDDDGIYYPSYGALVPDRKQSLNPKGIKQRPKVIKNDNNGVGGGIGLSKGEGDANNSIKIRSDVEMNEPEIVPEIIDSPLIKESHLAGDVSSATQKYHTLSVPLLVKNMKLDPNTGAFINTDGKLYIELDGKVFNVEKLQAGRQWTIINTNPIEGKTRFGPPVEFRDGNWHIMKHKGLRGGAGHSTYVQNGLDKDLYKAVMSKNVNAVMKLRERGAKANLVDEHGNSLLDIVDGMKDISSEERSRMRFALLHSLNPSAPKDYMKPEAFHGTPWGLEILESGSLKGGITDPKGGSQSKEGQVFFSDRSRDLLGSTHTRIDLRNKPRAYSEGVGVHSANANSRAKQYRYTQVLIDSLDKNDLKMTAQNVNVEVNNLNDISTQEASEWLQNYLHESYILKQTEISTSLETIKLEFKMPSQITLKSAGQTHVLNGPDLVDFYRKSADALKHSLESGKAPYLAMLNRGGIVPVVFGFEKIKGLQYHDISKGTKGKKVHRYAYQTEDHPLSGSSKGGALKEIELRSFEDLATLFLGMEIKGVEIPENIVFRIKGNKKNAQGKRIATYLNTSEVTKFQEAVRGMASKFAGKAKLNDLGIEKLQEITSSIRDSANDLMF